MSNKEYNGWKNYQTWNVALWIDNSEGLYHAARDYAARHPTVTKGLYAGFARMMGLEGSYTPDRVKWLSNLLDYPALNAMMRELAQ